MARDNEPHTGRALRNAVKKKKWVDIHRGLFISFFFEAFVDFLKINFFLPKKNILPAHVV